MNAIYLRVINIVLNFVIKSLAHEAYPGPRIMTSIVGSSFFSGDVRTLFHNYFGLPNSGDPNWEATIGIHRNDSAASCFSAFGRG
jgi:hypothetical protein